MSTTCSYNRGRVPRLFATLMWIICRSRAYYRLGDHQGNPSTKLAKPICIGRGREPTTGLAIDFKNMHFDQRHYCAAPAPDPRSRSLLSFIQKHEIRCWHVHVISSLIYVNHVLPCASRAYKASRKHCLVNNTNVGQCHATADDRQPCCLRRAAV